MKQTSPIGFDYKPSVGVRPFAMRESERNSPNQTAPGRLLEGVGPMDGTGGGVGATALRRTI